MHVVDNVGIARTAEEHLDESAAIAHEGAADRDHGRAATGRLAVEKGIGGDALQGPRLDRLRAQRFALVADDGVVTKLAVEAPMKFEVSSAEAILAAL